MAKYMGEQKEKTIWWYLDGRVDFQCASFCVEVPLGTERRKLDLESRSNGGGGRRPQKTGLRLRLPVSGITTGR